MNIGVVGSGRIGGTLGKLWAAKGHRVLFGLRDPKSETARDLAASSGDTRVGSLAEAVAFGDVIAFAVPWPAAEEVVSNTGNWSGKIVIDATNRFGPASKGSVTSAAEDLARLATGAKVFKAFNTIGVDRLARPQFDSQKASMFICGDDPEAKSVVSSLVSELGFEVVDTGPLGNAGLLESLAGLWVALARGSYGKDIAFRLLTG